MRIYLAARYEDRELMRDWAHRLEERGHQVESCWIHGGHESDDTSRWANFADEDYCDLLFADVLIFYGPREHFRTGRGGRHVEFGIALAKGISIYLVGERENVFHWLPRVRCCATIEQVMEEMSK